MKKIILFFLSLAFYTTSFAQETWEVDHAHSNLRFEVGWEDFSMRTGEFKLFEGTIITESKDDLSNAAIEFKVDAASVDVIADRLAVRVKSDKFLEVDKFPEITYVSKDVKPTSDSTYLSTGQLTIHGVTQDQEVIVWMKGSKESKGSLIFGLEVSLAVNRNDFGLDWGTPRLAETIHLVGHLIYKEQKEEKE